MPSSLLILGCSRRKLPTPGLLPAIKRYDGPQFRLVRRFLRLHPDSLDVLILSAKFGLISSDDLIPYYDEQMTPIRAFELRDSSLNILQSAIQKEPRTVIVVSLGKNYYPVIADFESLILTNIRILKASGSIGARLSFLHKWLYQAQQP